MDSVEEREREVERVREMVCVAVHGAEMWSYMTISIVKARETKLNTDTYVLFCFMAVVPLWSMN